MKVTIKKIIKSEDLQGKYPLIIKGKVFYQYSDYHGVKEVHITEENISIIQEFDDNKGIKTDINPNEEYVMSVKIEAEGN